MSFWIEFQCFYFWLKILKTNKLKKYQFLDSNKPIPNGLKNSYKYVESLGSKYSTDLFNSPPF